MERKGLNEVLRLSKALGREFRGNGARYYAYHAGRKLAAFFICQHAFLPEETDAEQDAKGQEADIEPALANYLRPQTKNGSESLWESATCGRTIQVTILINENLRWPEGACPDRKEFLGGKQR